MLKRTLHFGTPCFLGVKNGQILFSPKNSQGKERTVPLEDVGFVILENPAITLSVRLIEKLNENGAAIVFCDGSHMPESMLLRFSGHSTHAETLRFQIEASTPLKKGLWKQTVVQKITNQATVLQRAERKNVVSLVRIAREVKSDDSDNREGAAARMYWGALFEQPGFKREREGEWPNPALNYGYAILRAASARALVSSGLYCALGIHHRNRYNPFALADDIMEPYRPFVDQLVLERSQEVQIEELDKETKQVLLQVLSMDTLIDGQRSPLMVALSRTTASLARSYAEGSPQLIFPTLP